MNGNDFKFERVIVTVGGINNPIKVAPEITQHTIADIINEYFKYIKYNNNGYINDVVLSLYCINKLTKAIKRAYLEAPHSAYAYIYFKTNNAEKYFIKIAREDSEDTFYRLFDLEKYRMSCVDVYIIPMESNDENAKINEDKAWVHNKYDFELNFNDILVDSIMPIKEAAFKAVQDTFDNPNLKEEDKTNLNDFIHDKTKLELAHQILNYSQQ